MSNAQEELKTVAFVTELALPPHIRELHIQYLRVQCVAAAQQMWDRLLSPEDRERLGGDFERAYIEAGGTVPMWVKLRGVSGERALIEVAYGIGFLTETSRDWLLREVGERFDDSQRTLDEAMLQTKLVVVEKPKQIFWNGELIEIDWDKEPALWSFFWELCQRSKRSETLMREHLAENMSPSAFSTRKGRLVNHKEFPTTMLDVVETASGGGYRLDLQPQDIRI
jgi:hypothetical protein